MPSPGATYGRGAATLAQWDLGNSDCILVMGSNMAENHPVAFRFVMQAKAKGATIMHADPRFPRTSAMADIYAPVRAGTDIAFMGGIIRHILENDLWFREYGLRYTNIATIIEGDFRSAGEDGEVDRYRCHTGHGFSMAALMHEHRVQLDDMLWQGVMSLQKSVALLNDAAERLAAAGDHAGAAAFREKAAQEKAKVDQLRHRALWPEEADAPGQDR